MVQVSSGGRVWNMNTLLKNNLDIIKKFNVKDWDFKFLISGDGMTRTGKSTIGFQIAQYIDSSFADNWRERVIFDGSKLIETAYKIGTNKALVYDEARQGLDSRKQMESYTKNLLDFFSQCGNLNHEIIIILPEFFELPKAIAITQSIALINCYTDNGFNRGQFDFFNRKDKRMLYIKGCKFLDYKAQNPSFKGTFIDYIPFDRAEYETYKIESIKEMKNKTSLSELKDRAEIHKIRCTKLIKLLMDEGKKSGEIADLLALSRASIFNTYLKEKV